MSASLLCAAEAGCSSVRMQTRSGDTKAVLQTAHVRSCPRPLPGSLPRRPRRCLQPFRQLDRRSRPGAHGMPTATADCSGLRDTVLLICPAWSHHAGSAEPGTRTWNQMCDEHSLYDAVPREGMVGRTLTLERARQLNSRSYFYEMLKDNPAPDS